MQSAADFCQQVTPVTKVHIMYLWPEQVQTSTVEVEQWAGAAVKGLMDIHQVIVSQGRLYMRPTSCYKSCCLVAGMIKPGCQGWSLTNVIETGDEEDEVVDSDLEDSDNGENSDSDSEDDEPLVETARKEKLKEAEAKKQEEKRKIAEAKKTKQRADAPRVKRTTRQNRSNWFYEME